MIEEKELYDKVAMVCSDLKLPYYPKLLLVSMVYRKIRYPLENMDEIIEKVTKDIVPEQYSKHKRKAFMPISVEKEIDMLESELHKCDNIPEELLEGMIIPNTVKYYMKKVIDFND
ncbi:MAG: hypothetical protein HFJ40_03420 [Clostridia bacterium]|nr:hypothetical protein [Clostridia bacterium]